MATNDDNKDLEKPTIDEEYLMQVISGEQNVLDKQTHAAQQSIHKSKEKTKMISTTFQRRKDNSIFLYRQYT